jgi:hypothetical protein
MIENKKRKRHSFISFLEILQPANNQYDNQWLSIGYLITYPYATNNY